MKRFNCNIVQFDPHSRSSDGNVIDQMADIVENTDTDLLIFPELSTTGYDIFGDIDSVAEPVPGPTTNVLGEAAADNDTEILYGMAVADEDEYYNSAIWLDSSGEIRARYDKRHPWGDEQNVFATGNQYLVVDAPFARVGVQICYDLNHPEASAAIARAECDVLINISAWSVRLERDWQTILPARALEQGAYVIGCNRAGTERGDSFCGRSTVIEPDGSKIIEMGDQSGQVSATLDPGVVTGEHKRNPMREDRPSTDASAKIE